LADSAIILRTPHRPQRLALTWLLALLWAAMIAWGSSDRFSAHHTYLWLRAVWEYFRWPLEHLEATNFTLRKIGHVSVYGVQSVLLFFAWRETLVWRDVRNSGRPTRRSAGRRFAFAVALAMLGTLLIASGDEFHQRFVPGRTSSPRDVLIDLAGAAIAQLILYRTVWTRRNQKAENS
jgi:VanZ family protein